MDEQFNTLRGAQSSDATLRTSVLRAKSGRRWCDARMRKDPLNLWLRWLGFFTLAVSFLVLSRPGEVRAQSKLAQAKGSASGHEATAPGTSPALKITIHMIGNQDTPTTMAVTADLYNLSDNTVYVRSRDTRLILPPEVQILVERGVGTLLPLFPTEGSSLSDNQVIRIPPKEAYQVIWYRPLRKSLILPVRLWPRYLTFTPGDYPITVETKYWDAANFEGYGYHVAFQSATMHFLPPQSIIFFGAALGGLLFWLLAIVKRRRKDGEPTPVSEEKGRWHIAARISKAALGAISAILFSWIVTIFLARVSETQFFIQVNVLDFWGALTVGFFANYGGWGLLDRMLRRDAEAPKKA